MLQITQDVYDAVITHALEVFPIEACGYLGEKDGVVSKAIAMTNADNSKEHFSFVPAEQFAVVKEFRAEGLHPSVVYHSHPETPARPSEEDIKLAYDPNISYVIVSLAEDEPVMKSFLIKNGTVEQEEIKIIA